MTSTFQTMPNSTKFYFPQGCVSKINIAQFNSPQGFFPNVGSPYLSSGSLLSAQIPIKTFNQTPSNLYKNRKSNKMSFQSTKKELNLKESGIKPFEEEYLCQSSLDKLTMTENKLRSANENFIHGIKETSQLLDSEEVSTTTESSGDHKTKHELVCAPPRRSRIMQFVNKDLEIYQEEHQNKFKTELCRNWELTGFCKFTERCAFAHGMHELKEKVFLPSNYKTKLCKQFTTYMYCPYGQRCQFLHILNERTEPQVHKDDGCVNYMNILKDNEKRIEAAIAQKNPKEFKYRGTSGSRPKRLSVFESLAKGVSLSSELVSPVSI